MFSTIVALFALIAVAFAAPKPEPAPQGFSYSSGVEYFSPYSYPAYQGLLSPYTAQAAAVPYTYPAYPGAYEYFLL